MLIGCFAIHQILLGWKTYLRYYETDELPNPRPTQPDKNRFNVAFWATFLPLQQIFFVGRDCFYFRKQTTETKKPDQILRKHPSTTTSTNQVRAHPTHHPIIAYDKTIYSINPSCESTSNDSINVFPGQEPYERVLRKFGRWLRVMELRFGFLYESGRKVRAFYLFFL